MPLPMAGGEGKTVLVAEDDADIRLLMCKALEREGFAVVAVDNGTEAARLALSTPVDVFILDVILPGLDGLEIVDRIRGNAATASTPIVLVSASVQEAQLEEGLRRGADLFIKKPFALRELTAAIHRFFPD